MQQALVLASLNDHVVLVEIIMYLRCTGSTDPAVAMYTAKKRVTGMLAWLHERFFLDSSVDLLYENRVKGTAIRAAGHLAVLNFLHDESVQV